RSRGRTFLPRGRAPPRPAGPEPGAGAGRRGGGREGLTRKGRAKGVAKGTRVLVTGAGGFIGHHLVTYLKRRGYWVRGVDIKYPEFTETDADEFELLDLRRWDNCLQATRGVDHVYALAADMGGMGFISSHHAQILYNNALINFHTLE